MPFSMAPPSNRVNRVAKLIINPDTGPITCCWDTCDRKARTIYPLRLHEHPLHIGCELVDQSWGMYGRHAHMTFCSEQHRRYWMLSTGWRAHELAARNKGRIYGYTMPGEKIGRYR